MGFNTIDEIRNTYDELEGEVSGDGFIIQAPDIDDIKIITTVEPIRTSTKDSEGNLQFSIKIETKIKSNRASK